MGQACVAGLDGQAGLAGVAGLDGQAGLAGVAGRPSILSRPSLAAVAGAGKRERMRSSLVVVL